MSNLRHELNPSKGHPAEPTGRLNSSSANLNVREDPKAHPESTLNKSLNNINNTYLDENSRRGDGANVISDRLNFGGGRSMVEGPPQIQYVTKEIIKEVYEDEYLPAVTPVEVFDDSININGKNILAETMAKAALLIMENNRLRWVESQRTAEITRLRAVPIPAPQPVVRTVVATPPPPPPVVVTVAPPPPPVVVRTVVAEPAPIPICPTCRRAWPEGPLNVSTVALRPSATYTTATPIVTRTSGTTVPVVSRVSGSAVPVVTRLSGTAGPFITTSPHITTIGQPGIIHRPPVVSTTTPFQTVGTTIPTMATSTISPPFNASPAVVRTTNSTTTNTFSQSTVTKAPPTITTGFDGQTTRTSGNVSTTYANNGQINNIRPNNAINNGPTMNIGPNNNTSTGQMQTPNIRPNTNTGPIQTTNTGSMQNTNNAPMQSPNNAPNNNLNNRANNSSNIGTNFNTNSGNPGMIKSSSTAQYPTSSMQQPQGMMRSPTVANYSNVAGNAQQNRK